MSTTELTASASPADFYPSPPTSPQPVKATDRLTLDETINTPKFGASVSGTSSKTPPCATEEYVRPSTPAESEASDEEQADAAVLASKLDEWKAALSLSEMKCGASTIKNEPCKNAISKDKIARMEDIIKLLWLSTDSPLATEAHLDALAKLVHCRHHDHPPRRDQRASGWLVSMPGGPRLSSPQKRLQSIWSGAPNTCTSNTKDHRPCRQQIKPERYYCNKTVQRIIEVAVQPKDDDDSLSDLGQVLQYHMLCKYHKGPRYTRQDTWTRRIDEFLGACQKEMDQRNEEIKKATKTPTLTEKLRGGDEHTLASPPPTPSRNKTVKHPSAYWDTAFETSRFVILGKGDATGEAKIRIDEIRGIAQTSLFTSSDKSRNEVNDGFIYLYQVPGNEGFVKIGFTTRTVEERHEEWKADCHREPTVLYPTAATCKAVPHARRVERLVHADLIEHQVRIYCDRCGIQHIEWFEISVKEGIEAIEKWSRWIETRPYMKRALRSGNDNWYLKESEMKRLADVPKFLEDLTIVEKQQSQTG
ncbi:hypothetical protein NLG97_g4867 [Lecanicillium saksenae]|uniref:Uncharacterized protein n=1 Tax=Lecanicillium saksenae TaxID=468837 RepID=A0ACC1QXB5_9HYPO|nr:hypothetical protein NLG97_g4867 [Lecanicillium saksenae]